MEYQWFFFSPRASRMPVKYNVKISIISPIFQFEKRRVEFKITFIIFEISRNIFFSFLSIISKTNDRLKKNYYQKMSTLTSSIQRYFLFFNLTYLLLTFPCFSLSDYTFYDWEPQLRIIFRSDIISWFVPDIRKLSGIRTVRLDSGKKI